MHATKKEYPFNVNMYTIHIQYIQVCTLKFIKNLKIHILFVQNVRIIWYFLISLNFLHIYMIFVDSMKLYKN